MYKLLLCLRYLKTRYLALACVISIMLGVATLIVVNSVMSGFSTKLRDKLHGLLSDILIESTTMDGFADPEGKMALIRKDPFLNDKIVAMAPTLEVFAMIQFDLPNGERMVRPVQLIGIDPESQATVGSFQQYLVNPANRRAPSFEMSPDAKKRYDRLNPIRPAVLQPPEILLDPDVPPPVEPAEPQVRPPHGAIIGKLIASFRYKDRDSGEMKEQFLLRPGEQFVMYTISGARLSPVYDSFVVVDYFMSEMSEHDSKLVFVPLDYLQHLRTMQNRVTSIQIKLKDYGDVKAVLAALHRLIPESPSYRIATWEEKQGPILQAIEIEKGILNVLLFLIICVAGFGILAIFSMIVTEKTRDIGILKALGASNIGVMKIFLSYGLLLGLVGTSLGTLLGVTLTNNINEVERFLSQTTGRELFNRELYYFDGIPTDIRAGSVVLINLGALLIAVLFSVLPALRAARLQPVQALRYE